MFVLRESLSRPLRAAADATPLPTSASSYLSCCSWHVVWLMFLANTQRRNHFVAPPPGMWQMFMQPIDYFLPFGVTSFSAPVDKSRTKPRITTSDGIHGCDLSFSTCFCVCQSTSE